MVMLREGEWVALADEGGVGAVELEIAFGVDLEWIGHY